MGGSPEERLRREPEQKKKKLRRGLKFSPITTEALAPGLSDFRAAPTAAVPVVVLEPPAVVQVVIAGAVRSGDLEEGGTSPIDPKPGRNA